MLAIECSASLVFRTHNPLKCGKVQSAKGIVLIAKQTLSSSATLDRLRPNVHHLPAHERLDLFISIPSKKP
jgi:hypothetical protein